MTPEAFQAEHDRIRAYFDKWIPLLYLHRWDLQITFVDDRCEDDSGTAMLTSAAWEYVHAGISVFCRTTSEQSDLTIEKIVVHELMHIMLDEIHTSEEDNLHDEHVASELAIAFLNVWDSGHPDPVDVPEERTGWAASGPTEEAA